MDPPFLFTICHSFLLLPFSHVTAQKVTNLSSKKQTIKCILVFDASQHNHKQMAGEINKQHFEFQCTKTKQNKTSLPHTCISRSKFLSSGSDMLEWISSDRLKIFLQYTFNKHFKFCRINSSRSNPARNFTHLCVTLKGFMKALKTFIKPFQAPERSAKIKL